MPSLIAKSPEFAGQVFSLTDQAITIGRAEENRIQIAHPSVSSHHAELRLEGADYYLVDLNSTNGTRVNDERITESPLRNQDVVMLGNILFTYQSEAAATAAPLPAVEAHVDLNASLGGARPASFVNLAPFAKVKAKSGGLSPVVAIAFLLAAGALGFYVYSTLMG
jgi:predicted component of type VI protein secretion system